MVLGHWSSLEATAAVSSYPIWRFPKLGVLFWGVPILRIIVFWGLYWGPLILGNYHFRWVYARMILVRGVVSSGDSGEEISL